MQRVGVPPGNPNESLADPGTPVKRLGDKRAREVNERGFFTAVSGAVIALMLAMLIGSTLTAYNYHVRASSLQDELIQLKNRIEAGALRGMDVAKDALHKAEEAVGMGTHRAGEAASAAQDMASGAASAAKEKAMGAAEVVRERAAGAADTVRDKAAASMPAPGAAWDSVDQAMHRIRDAFSGVMRHARPAEKKTHEKAPGTGFPDLPALLQDVDAGVGELFKALPTLADAVGEWEPTAQLRDERDEWVVDVAAPAGSKPSFTVDVVGSLVVVAAEEAEDTGSGDVSTHRHRRFVQSFSVPGLPRVDPSSISASTGADGASLVVRIPKSAAALHPGAYRVPLAPAPAGAAAADASAAA
eukprot:tig00000955_g5800.t1